MRIAKQIFSTLFFPLGLYQALHNWMGKTFVIPAARTDQLSLKERTLKPFLRSFNDSSAWKYQRIAIEVDGMKIDAVVVGKEAHLLNGRWMLISNGNAQFLEESMQDENYASLLEKTASNALFFNYPGVGASEGKTSKQALVNSYRAMLSFLENSVEAKEIIGYGHSIGAAVQAEALQNYKFQSDVRYAFAKSRTFSLLSAVPSSIIIQKLQEQKNSLSWLAEKIAAVAIRAFTYLLGWEMNVVQNSKELEKPELILQTGLEPLEFFLQTGIEPLDPRERGAVLDDGVISKNASLAEALIEDPTFDSTNKKIHFIPEKHNDRLKSDNIDRIAADLNAFLLPKE